MNIICHKWLTSSIVRQPCLFLRSRTQECLIQSARCAVIFDAVIDCKVNLYVNAQLQLLLELIHAPHSWRDCCWFILFLLNPLTVLVHGFYKLIYKHAFYISNRVLQGFTYLCGKFLYHTFIDDRKSVGNLSIKTVLSQISFDNGPSKLIPFFKSALSFDS